MNQELWEKWFSKENEKLHGNAAGKKPKRGYLHFDNRITSLDESLTRKLLDPEAVTKHSFYPFIRIDTRQPRFRRTPDRPDRTRRERRVKKRPIDFAAHKDSLIFSWYSTLLSEKYELEIHKRGMSQSVIAYRSFKTPGSSRGKNNADFAKDAFDFIANHAPSHIIAVDISRFYEEVRHDLLKEKWAYLLGTSTLPPDHFQVFKAVTQYRFVRRGRIREHIARALRAGAPRIFTPKEFQKAVVYKNMQERGVANKGIPQGSQISCLLANVYMLDFDTVISRRMTELAGLYRRYSDDILIVVAPEHAKEIKELIDSEVKNLGLTIKPEKTEERISIENEGHCQTLDVKTGKVASFQYLGIETSGNIPIIRHGSLAKFQRRMNRGARKAIIHSVAKERSDAPKKFLFEKYGRPGKNFLGYAFQVARTFDSRAILHQVSPIRNAKRLRTKISELKTRLARKK